MKKLFTLFAAVVAALAMNATVVEFTPADFEGQGTESTGSAVSATKDGVTVSCDKAFGHNLALRCYKNSVLTISSTETITSLVFQFYSTYTGSLNEQISVNATSWTNTMGAQARIENLKVYINETPTTITIDTIVGTIAEIIAAQTPETNTTNYYQTSGTVGTILSSEYGNYYLHDGNDSVMVYGTLDADGKTRNFASLGIKEGDNITILGRMKMFNSTLEFVDVKVLSGAVGATIDTINVAEAMSIGQALADQAETAQKYCVIGYAVKLHAAGYDTDGGYQTVYMSDDPTATFGDFQAYKCNVAAPGVAQGDKIAVTGKILKYGTNIEIKSGSMEVIEHATGLNDIEVEKAVKTIENGQLIIIRNGVKYNANGMAL